MIERQSEALTAVAYLTSEVMVVIGHRVQEIATSHQPEVVTVISHLVQVVIDRLNPKIQCRDLRSHQRESRPNSIISWVATTRASWIVIRRLLFLR